MGPTTGQGKVCYMILPARDPHASAEFYSDVFSWNIRERAPDDVRFDDGVGEVSGMWVTGRPPVDASFVYIMVDDMARTCDAIASAGGQVTEAPDYSAREVVATFRDPAGNTLGIYQERGPHS